MNFRIKWSTLLPTTLTASVIALFAISSAATQGSATNTAVCGPHEGPLCREWCASFCSPPNQDMCCTWKYIYFDKIQ